MGNNSNYDESNKRASSRKSTASHTQSQTNTNNPVTKKRLLKNVTRPDSTMKNTKPKLSNGIKKISASMLPKLEQSKSSTTNFKIIRAYAVNTSRGIIRNYNEDRVAIILNIMKPDDKNCKYWPNCSFFGVYDGHGGSACADFLRDN